MKTSTQPSSAGGLRHSSDSLEESPTHHLHPSWPRPQARWPHYSTNESSNSVIPADTSHAGSLFRYAAFVVSMALLVSSTFIAIPALLVLKLSHSQECPSLEKDLSESRDPSVHPCDDFYRYTCHGTDHNPGSANRIPLQKYQVAFDHNIVKQMLLRRIPGRPVKAKDKASALLLRCLSHNHEHESLTIATFLGDLGLKWPLESSTTRYQLFVSLGKASLRLGMPMLWGFYVGRHPSGSLKNTIYMTLDSRYNDWIGTVEMLMYKRRVRDYLRHCAEIVGGKGQSYESMIEDVLQAHHELAAAVVAYWDPFSGPRYVDLSDPDLRRAVNGQLPDDSQLWWKNEIVNLQPELYHRLNDTFFSLDEYRKRFTVLFGAYVVWALLPLISSSRTANILADMHSPSRTVIEQRLQCYGLLQEVMPLAKWHIDNEALAEGEATRHLLRLAVLSANKLVTPYGESVRKRAEITNALLSLNALNMSETWEELDKAYDYLPNESSKDFFKLFLSASRATITMFKRSLRRPRNTIFHVPGIASDWLYRLLVVREVILPNSLASPPLVMPWHPAAVRVALAGTFISYQILIFMLFKFFYNDHFEEYKSNQVSPSLLPFIAAVEQYVEVLKRSDLVPDMTRQEIRHLTIESLAAVVASGILRMPDFQLLTTARADEPKEQSFEGIPPEQLYFMVNCFTRCGKVERRLSIDKALCNVALPAAASFRRAFGCSTEHRLTTHFTWPEEDVLPDS